MLEAGTEPPAGSNTCRDETSNTNKEAKRFFLLQCALPFHSPNNKIEGQEIKLDDSYNVKVMEFPWHITPDKSCLETDNKEPQHNGQEQK